MEDLGGFLKQVPIGLLLAPVVFLVLYIVLLVIIFQRAAAKRRRRQLEREQMEGVIAGSSAARGPQATPMPQAAMATTASARKPIQPIRPLPKPAPVAVPEPDLDLLAAPPFTPLPPVASFAQPASPAVEAQTSRAEQMVEPPMDLPSTTDAESAAAAAQARPDLESLLIPVPGDQVVEFNAMPVPNPENQSAPADAVEVMRVWRDLSDGSLIIQMGNTRYRTMDEIAGADLARRFSALVRELSTMANAAPPAPELPGAAKARLGLLNQAPPEEVQPKSGVFRQLGRAAIGQNAAAAKTEKRADGIANAVEEFLQYKLTDHPEFSTRSIHIRPANDGGVRIEVDGRYWDGIGDVSDTAVRDFLATVMREWEARQ